MFRTRDPELLLQYAVAVVMVAMLVCQIFAWRGLYADGSFQLINLLIVEGSGHPPDLFHELVTHNNEPLRFFAYILMELPTIIALRLGLTNLNTLITIFSSWLLAVPLIFWGLALWRLRKDTLFWAFLMLFTAVYFNGNFFIIGEFNLAYGLTACCAAYILKADTNTKRENAFLLFIALASVMSYGATLFTGPLLCFLAGHQFIKSNNMRTKSYWALLAILFALSAAAGMWGYLHPQLPENLQNARNPRVLAFDMQFWFTLIFAIATAAQILIAKDWRGRAAFALCTFALLFPILSLKVPPFMDYQVRAFTGLVFFGFLCVICGYALFGTRYLRWPDVKLQTQSFVPVFLLFFLLAISDIQSSFEFRSYINNVRNEVNSYTGLLPYEASDMLLPGNSYYSWTWTHPSMSLLLRHNEKGALVMDPIFQRGRWSPFDPARPPDLSRYYSKT